MIVIIHTVFLDAVDIPGEVKKQFEVITCHLRIMHIGYPYLPDIMVVSLSHLVVDESRLSGGEPEMVVWPSPIAEVVIHSCPTLALLFLRFAHAGDVTVVVVAPHQGDIIRHFESFLIDIKHLFIRNEYLSKALRTADMLTKQLLLVVYDLLKRVKFLLFGLHSLHVSIMYASHSDGKHIVTRMLHLFQTFYPVVLHRFFISDIIKSSTHFLIPFSYIIAEHRLTVGRSDDYTATICHRLCIRHEEERRSAWVHSRPYRIGSQAEKQFEYASVSLRSYLSFRSRFVGSAAPLAQAPVLVIDEYATIFHACALHGLESVVQFEPLSLLRHHVVPPYPGRNACHSGEFEQSVSHASAVASRHYYLAVSHSYGEAVSVEGKRLYANALMKKAFLHGARCAVELVKHYLRLRR